MLSKIFNNDINIINWTKTYIYNGKGNHCIFNTAPLNIDDLMKKIIIKNSSTIFCSATLAIDGDFSYFMKETGFDYLTIDENIATKIYPSPYFYNDQVKLFVLSSNDTIDSINFVKNISMIIMDIKKKIKKRTLILCTSYNQINLFKDILGNNLNDNIFSFKTTLFFVLLGFVFSRKTLKTHQR